MPWYFAVAELQNPTSAEKIRLFGDRLRLAPGKHVLDLASGRGGPALILAKAFGCRVTGIERSAEFYEAACERARAAGLESLVEFVHADARDVSFEREAYDVAMCLGASFIWNGLEGALAALSQATGGGSTSPGNASSSGGRSSWAGSAQTRPNLARTPVDHMGLNPSSRIAQGRAISS